MPENEFEKKIANELNDLKLNPSEQVWLKVEERIRKKKKRRGFFILFFFAGLALLGWWQQENIFGNGNTRIANQELKKEILKAENELPSTSNTVSTPEQENVKTDSPIKKNDQVQTQSLIQNINQNKVAENISDNKKERKGQSKFKKASVVEEDKEIRVPEVTETEKKNLIDISTGVVLEKNISEPKEKRTDISEKKIADTSGATIITTTKTDERKPLNEQKEDTVLQNKETAAHAVQTGKKNSSSSKWKWGVHFTPGISTLKESFINLNMAKSADAFAYTNSSSGSGGFRMPVPPAESKSGFAFQFGGFVQRQLSSRTSLSLGLQYGNYSDRIRIGEFKDTILSNAYFDNSDASKAYSAANSTKDYTNHYHFVELPVLFSWRLNKNENRPFTWDMGVTLSRLMATNALVYDTAFGGIYYNDKNIFNKTHFSVSTGLSWTLINNKKLQWSAGPAIDFFTTRIQNSSMDNRNYILFFWNPFGSLIFF